MRTGLILLTLTYILSQFYRAFLGVLGPSLQAQLGMTEVQLSNAASAWFLVFAAAQLPIGWAFDTVGPRRTTSALVVLAAGSGAWLFALATSPWHVTLAMGLIGLGCAPMLMASFFIIARGFPAAVFATYAAMVVGIGNLGNIAASTPLAWMLDAVGWRATLGSLAAVTMVCGVLIALVLRDPDQVETKGQGSILDLLRIPALWLIIPVVAVNYGPSASIRGLWIGPYLDQVHGATTVQIGNVTFLAALLIAVGTLVIGPLDRVFGTRKWVVFTGVASGAVFCALLAQFGGTGIWTAGIFAALLSISGATFAVIMAHAKAFIPPHLTGRGVTLVNMFGIGGVGVLQAASGQVFDWSKASATDVAQPFEAVFWFFTIVVLIGTTIYLFSRDSLD